MTPPKASVAGKLAAHAEMPSAVSVVVTVLRKRSDFLLAARAKRVVMPGFVFQARKREETEPNGSMRIGYTCSKKVGNAVARNRAKRRMREIAAMMLPVHGHIGWDYVLIGRKNITAVRLFTDLQNDLHKALTIVHGKKT